MRIVSIVLALALGFVSTALAEEIINPYVMLDGKNVTLGDVFPNVKSAKDRIVAHAPMPGKRLVLSSTALSNLANRNNVDWQPVTGKERLVIERKSRVLSTKEILNTLKPIAIAEIGREDIELELNKRQPKIRVAASSDPEIHVHSFILMNSQKSFKATLRVIEEGEIPQTVTLAGKINTTIEIPTLKEPAQHGYIIGPKDIDFKKVASRLISAQVVTDMDQLIGKTPRRGYIQAGKVIRMSDIKAPTLVKRGSIVTVTYRTPSLKLSVRAKAKSDGAEGDYVQFIRANSKTIIEAKVVSHGQAIIEPVSMEQ